LRNYFSDSALCYDTVMWPLLLCLRKQLYINKLPLHNYVLYLKFSYLRYWYLSLNHVHTKLKIHRINKNKQYMPFQKLNNFRD
jgi:hypothetical protein